jgi:aspartate carbamoyltransferase catalytic subunit
MIADKGPATPLSQLEREKFLDQFMEQVLCLMVWGPLFISMEQKIGSYDVAWWVRSQDESFKHPNCQVRGQHVFNVESLFSTVHTKASRKIVFHYMPFTNSIFSVTGIEDVALFAGTPERRCSRSFKNSVGRFQAG